MKTKEIELKLLFKNKGLIIKKLMPDIKFVEKVKVLDNYYGKKEFSIRDKNDLVRIRIINNDTELTYKSRKRNKGRIIKKSELTIKIPLNSVKLMEKILINLGLKAISEHRSEKEYWRFKGAEIVFSKFTKPANLSFMEIEADSEIKIKEIFNRIYEYVLPVKENIFSEFDKANKKNRK